MTTIQIQAYDPSWPETFQKIKAKLETYLEAGRVSYKDIEHIGSTSVPGMPSKNNIDIIIIVPDAEQVEKAKEALIHEPPETDYYKYIGDGGIKGRISMKLQDRQIQPQQSVYIVRENDDDQVGKLLIRNYRSLRDTLRNPENKELKKAYAEVKLAMSDEGITDGVVYGRRKNGVIRQILKSSGWTDEEVDAKEQLDYRLPRRSPSPGY